MQTLSSSTISNLNMSYKENLQPSCSPSQIEWCDEDQHQQLQANVKVLQHFFLRQNACRSMQDQGYMALPMTELKAKIQERARCGPSEGAMMRLQRIGRTRARRPRRSSTHCSGLCKNSTRRTSRRSKSTTCNELSAQLCQSRPE